MTDTILTQIQNTIDSRKGGDPEASYVAQLLHKGEDKILKKVIEEAGEVWIAAEYQTDDELAEELSQLLYWAQTIMIARGLTPADVYKYL